MAHSGGIQTPVGEIAPYIARNVRVNEGSHAGRLTILLRAPPNANVQLVQLSGYGSWGSGTYAFFWLVPPEGDLVITSVSDVPNTYPLFSGVSPLEGSTIDEPVCFYCNERGMSGAPIWIPAGWALAVAPQQTTSGSFATFSAVGIMHPSITAGAFQN